MGKYILWNGSIVPKETANISVTNRGTLYGDGLFETMRCKGIIPPFYDLHWNRLESGLQFLKIDFQHTFNKQTLLESIQQLIHKEKFYNACSVRVNCFRKEGGKYTPTNNDLEYFIEAFPLPETSFTLNKKGLKTGIFEGVPKPISPLSKFKHSNALPSILAGIYKTEQKLDDCFLLNEHDSLVEAISSNIYIKKGNKLFTPALSTGCVNGTIRRIMPLLANQAGLELSEEAFIHPDILNDADEVFVTNAISGIQWVVAYNRKRYFYQTSQKLIWLLNAYFEEQHTLLATR